MNLEKMAEKYRDAGYSERNADARVCQDIVLKAIARSNLGRNVTIKGGVVMRSITGNVRRATEDLDLDFIRYSLEDESIRYFISKLNCLEGIRIEIKGNKIEQLSQQEYSGKRVYIIIKDDEGNVIESKIDLGVHANMNIEQDTYCFDVCMDDEGASLLINSCEQIFAEKLRSLLRFGPLSTRYKDIFDFCYLKDHVDMLRLADCMLNGIKNVCGNIYGVVKSGFDKAISFVKGLATQAFQWGADFIGGIVNGIKSMIGKVGEAVSSVAEKIKSFLHFSVPDEGPLTDYESWMPDFIGGLAKGIEKSRGMIDQAMQGVTGDMTITPRMMAAQGGYSGSIASNGDLISGINTALNTALAGGGAAGDIVIPVYIGGDMIDEIVVTAQQRMNLRSGGR